MLYPRAGSAGLAGTTLLPKCPRQEMNTDFTAIEAIHDVLVARPPDSVWLVAIGPLTNVAHLLLQYPEAASQLGGLNIMGGALADSYTTARLGKSGDKGELVGYPNRWAEFNIWVGSGIPTLGILERISNACQVRSRRCVCGV